jgi:transporter family protein
MKAILFAVAAGLCWGIGELCTKSVLHSQRIGPITAIAVRSTVALPVLWLAWYVAARVYQAEPRAGLRALAGGDLAKLILGSGLLAGAAGMIFFYAALHLDDISRIKPIAFTVAPAVAALLGWLVLGESMTWRKGFAIALIASGVVLLTGNRARPTGPPAETPTTAFDGTHAPR